MTTKHYTLYALNNRTHQLCMGRTETSDQTIMEFAKAQYESKGWVVNVVVEE